MIPRLAALLVLLLLPVGAARSAPAGPYVGPDNPSYNADGSLKLPENYREWIYLTSNLDMNYNDPHPVVGHSTFQNVFVNPMSYRGFLATGNWPDKTTFVLELRSAEAHVNIDKRGQSQTTDLRTIELHVKDESKIPGKWGFYDFGSDKSAKLIDRPAGCYTCHEAHAAVDTTFVQFYPTLIGIAKTKNTLSPEYLKDTAFPAAAPEGR